jgi:dTDP-4-amino-4,6-dideoxygalactose transaminase
MSVISRSGNLAGLSAATTVRLLSGGLYTFVQGLPDRAGMESSKVTVGSSEPRLVAEYESAFAALIGAGQAVSFASGRMGFFALMRSLGIGPGDEVILPGYTCAVMPNAVMRIGATPVYADISPEHFGSTSTAIERLVTSRTRMIVAQHSFGFPCEIGPIAELARRCGIFLLEDCATTLGSTVDGQPVGTFGDAALFSTDHTKPLATHTGGLIYSSNPSAVDDLRAEQAGSGEISAAQQSVMWKRMAREGRHRTPSGQLRLFAADTARGLLRSQSLSSAFLSEDFASTTGADSYPYPARLPSFLARIGLSQIAAWPQRAEARRRSLGMLLSALADSSAHAHLPRVLDDPRVSITPLRLAWSQPDGGQGRQRLRTRIATEGTWFRSPISVSADPLDAYGYSSGACPESERLGPGMINIPILDNEADAQRLASFVHTRFAD